MHEITADRLRQQHAYLEDGLALAARRAGAGPDHVLDRRLRSEARTLQSMLADAVAARSVADAVEAAQRVMDTTAPDAPLHMLALAREQLAREVRRHALSLPRARHAA